MLCVRSHSVVVVVSKVFDTNRHPQHFHSLLLLLFILSSPPFPMAPSQGHGLLVLDILTFTAFFFVFYVHK